MSYPNEPSPYPGQHFGHPHSPAPHDNLLNSPDTPADSHNQYSGHRDGHLDGQNPGETDEKWQHYELGLGQHAGQHPYQHVAQEAAQDGGQVSAAASPSRPILRFWALEITSLAIAAGFIAAIWAIMARYDGQPIPDWALSINLSTLVSLLAVGFRLAVISPIAAVMAQQKWSWLLRGSRPLRDLQRLDSASNGVVASAQLLALGPRSPTAMLGATILLLALAVGPIAQQSIQTVPCEQTESAMTASVPVANYIRAYSRRYGATDWDIDDKGKGALLNGLLNPLGNDTVITPECLTGNCRFPEYGGVTYKSVGLCHTCLDTSFLFNATIRGNKSEVFSYPGGRELDNALNGYRLVVSNITMADQKLFTPEVTAAAANAISMINVLATTNTSCSVSPDARTCNTSAAYEGSRGLAVTCAFYPCVQRFHGIVVDGKLDEKVVSTSPLSKAATVPDKSGTTALLNYTALETPCIIDDVPYDTTNFDTLDKSKYSFMNVVVNGKNISAPYECIYILDGQYARALGKPLCASLDSNEKDAGHCMFNGRCTYANNNKAVICSGPFWLEKFWGGGAATLASVNDIISQFATVASSYFRKAGTSLYAGPRTPDGIPGIPRPAVGTVHRETFCVSFAWGWLMWPMALYVVTVALLVVTVLSPFIERELPIWKASPLPLLFYTMEKPVPLGELIDEKELDERAKGMNVEFLRQGEMGVVRVT